MPARLQLSTFAVSILCSLLLLPASGQAQATARIPEFTVTDQNGTVVGAFLETSSRFNGTSSKNFVLVLRRDTTNDENYTFYVGTNNLQGADEDDVWYSDTDCTGTAYLESPENSTYDSELPQLRGSIYAIGRKDGALYEDSLILRGSGAGADNSGSIQSRYRTDADGSSTSCNAGTTSNDTVVAVEIEDLSSHVRPYKVD